MKKNFTVIKCDTTAANYCVLPRFSDNVKVKTLSEPKALCAR